MITPTRFGLKYAPIPTLALEYEDDLRSIDDGATTSLYVYNGDELDKDKANQRNARRMKKLHVVELPALTKHSEAVAVARQLQQDNERFLSPSVVKEDQLVRLLERLMAHLQVTELSVSSSPIPAAKEDTGGGRPVAAAMAGKFGSYVDAGSGDEGGDHEQESESELEESAMDSSIAETSTSMDVSKGDGKRGDDGEDDSNPPKLVAHTRHQHQEGEGVPAAAADESFKPSDSQLKSSQEAQGQSEHNGKDDASTAAPTTSLAKQSGAASDDEDDAVKRRALRSESEASDDNEEDIQSEELEYFSEDVSDEDSF